jgi:hypothetical protein
MPLLDHAMPIVPNRAIDAAAGAPAVIASAAGLCYHRSVIELGT